MSFQVSIESALYDEMCQTHRAAIAQVLGVSERNIYRLLKRHDLS